MLSTRRKPDIFRDTHINEVPNEILNKILKNLDYAARDKAGQSCRRFKCLVDNIEHRSDTPIYPRLSITEDKICLPLGDPTLHQNVNEPFKICHVNELHVTDPAMSFIRRSYKRMTVDKLTLVIRRSTDAHYIMHMMASIRSWNVQQLSCEVPWHLQYFLLQFYPGATSHFGRGEDANQGFIPPSTGCNLDSAIKEHFENAFLHQRPHSWHKVSNKRGHDCLDWVAWEKQKCKLSFATMYLPKSLLERYTDAYDGKVSFDQITEKMQTELSKGFDGLTVLDCAEPFVDMIVSCYSEKLLSFTSSDTVPQSVFVALQHLGKLTLSSVQGPGIEHIINHKLKEWTATRTPLKYLHIGSPQYIDIDAVIRGTKCLLVLDYRPICYVIRRERMCLVIKYYENSIDISEEMVGVANLQLNVRIR